MGPPQISHRFGRIDWPAALSMLPASLIDVISRLDAGCFRMTHWRNQSLDVSVARMTHARKSDISALAIDTKVDPYGQNWTDR